MYFIRPLQFTFQSSKTITLTIFSIIIIIFFYSVIFAGISIIQKKGFQRSFYHLYIKKYFLSKDRT